MAKSFDLFRNRSLLILGISESVSNIGNWITMLAVFAMIVFKDQGGVAESGGVFLAGLLPILLFSPVAGWLSDRFDRKWLMIASELLAGLSIMGLVFITRLEWIYALLAIQAVFVSWMSPARQAAVPDIIPAEDLSRANAFLQQLNGLIKILAPVLAGAVLAVLNPHQAIILDVVSFALSALILTRLPALPPHPASAVREENLSAPPTANALHILRDQPMLRLLFLSTFLAIAVIIGFDILAPIYTRDILAASEQLLSLEISLVGVGTLAMTVWLVVRPGARKPWRDLVMGMLLLALIPMGFAVAARLSDLNLARSLALGGCLVGGAGNGLVVVQSTTMLQQFSPPAFLGRMGGLFQTTAVAGQLVGMLLTPLIVPALLALGAYFTVSAILLLGVVVYMGWVLRHVPD